MSTKYNNSLSEDEVSKVFAVFADFKKEFTDWDLQFSYTSVTVHHAMGHYDTGTLTELLL